MTRCAAFTVFVPLFIVTACNDGPLASTATLGSDSVSASAGGTESASAPEGSTESASASNSAGVTDSGNGVSDSLGTTEGLSGAPTTTAATEGTATATTDTATVTATTDTATATIGTTATTATTVTTATTDTTDGTGGTEGMDSAGSESAGSTSTTNGEMSGQGSSGVPDEEVGCVPIDCEGTIFDCGDCLDNDGDGKADLADPECISPCDDREDVFATGLPGDNNDPCKQDCFFDGNSGQGDDHCEWNLKCDPLYPGGEVCPYDPDYNNCPENQPQGCIDFCIVPNGCDCFGCCTVTVDGQSHDVFFGDKDCKTGNIAECLKCTKNEVCNNPCEPDKCEICLGESEPPDGCGEASCPDGKSCTVNEMGGSDDCEEGTFCSTGCCVPVVPA